MTPPSPPPPPPRRDVSQIVELGNSLEIIGAQNCVFQLFLFEVSLIQRSSTIISPEVVIATPNVLINNSSYKTCQYVRLICLPMHHAACTHFHRTAALPQPRIATTVICRSPCFFFCVKCSRLTLPHRAVLTLHLQYSVCPMFVNVPLLFTFPTSNFVFF